MKKPIILIVDDEKGNIKLLKAMLMGQDYDLLEAFGGEEALKIVSNQNPDLILLDVLMPGIDGLEVCRRIKENKNNRGIPIIMITALTEKEDRIKAMEAGADDFLSKPVDQTELVVRIKSLLRIKSYHDELFSSYWEIAEINEKLRELEKIKDGLIHMITHDLRNPLTAISSYLQSILMDNQSLDEKQKKRMEVCHKYCQYLGRLIEIVLDANKIEGGKLEPHQEVTSLAELILRDPKI